VTDSDRSAEAAPDDSGAMAHIPPIQAGEASRGPSRPPVDRRTSHAPSLARRPRGPLYAALDLGTNNCRLLIARPH